jgi:16S rRNA (guanine527-N7)-methyltransferase
MKIPKELLLNDSQCLMINQYIAIIQKWNATYRLVGDASTERVMDRHVGDSLAARMVLEKLTASNDEVSHLVDLGSGAGFPGIPLNIVYNDMRVTLVDAQRKRVGFCDCVRRELGLANVTVVHGRADDPDVVGRVGCADMVISRATWRLSGFLEQASPYLARLGWMVAMKGKRWQQELDEVVGRLPQLGVRLLDVLHYQLPISNDPRTLIVFRRDV